MIFNFQAAEESRRTKFLIRNKYSNHIFVRSAICHLLICIGKNMRVGQFNGTYRHLVRGHGKTMLHCFTKKVVQYKCVVIRFNMVRTRKNQINIVKNMFQFYNQKCDVIIYHLCPWVLRRVLFIMDGINFQEILKFSKSF